MDQRLVSVGAWERLTIKEQKRASSQNSNLKNNVPMSLLTKKGRAYCVRFSNDDIKPGMKALHITDKIKSRDEAIDRAIVKLLPEPI